MAEVYPFPALRFTRAAGDIATLCCPPYDIIKEEDRQRYLRKNARNIVRMELPREGDDPYAATARLCNQWIREGLLRRDPFPWMYIYEEEFLLGDRHCFVRGCIGRVHLEEFSSGIILPHEETLSQAKEDRFSLLQATGCQFSQIYAFYTDPDQTTDRRFDVWTTRRPSQVFADEEGVVHRLWVVDDPDVAAAICGDFNGRKLYIADGHHRYETALRYRRQLVEKGAPSQQIESASYTMMMLVNTERPGLAVFPTHRVIRGLTDFDVDALITACRKDFDVESCGSNAKRRLADCYAKGEKVFALYAGKNHITQWYLLHAPSLADFDALLPDRSPAYRGLDVTILHTLVFKNILGFHDEDMAGGHYITYTQDSTEATALVDSGEANCAFLLNPPRISEIRDVAAAGEKMPQKSTYFYPKLITGMVMNQLGG